MKISASHLGNLFNYASYRGVDESHLRGFLSDKTLDLWNSKNTVTESEFLAVFDEMLNLTGDPYFGLHYGCYLNINAMQFIAELSLNATHIEQAVFILQNYFHQSFPLAGLNEIRNDTLYILQLESGIEKLQLKRQLLDAVYSFLFREFRLMCTNEQMPDLTLPYKNLAEYSIHLHSDIKGGNGHCFLFQPEILNSKINKKKTSEIEFLLPEFLQMLDKEKYRNRPFSNRVRKMILQLCKPEPPSFEQVVVHFPVSDRTFQRKLNGEGLSFRKITNEIKIELSTYLSKGKNMKTQDIAHILGYSEPSAYLHAVKRWHN
jgi:AraC-like DNA-binding protein